jgi:hypothetical protein
MDTLIICVLWLVQKSGEVILCKLLDKLFSKKNFNYLAIFLKIQVLILYINWIFLKTSLKSQASNKCHSEH